MQTCMDVWLAAHLFTQTSKQYQSYLLHSEHFQTTMHANVFGDMRTFRVFLWKFAFCNKGKYVCVFLFEPQYLQYWEKLFRAFQKQIYFCSAG